MQPKQSPFEQRRRAGSLPVKDLTWFETGSPEDSAFAHLHSPAVSGRRFDGLPYEEND